MRFEDMRNFQPCGARHFDIAFAVAARIDHRRLAAGTDEVGQVRQTGGFDFLEQHFVLLGRAPSTGRRDRRKPIPPMSWIGLAQAQSIATVRR